MQSDLSQGYQSLINNVLFDTAIKKHEKLEPGGRVQVVQKARAARFPRPLGRSWERKAVSSFRK